jgi:hypothetical protein
MADGSGTRMDQHSHNPPDDAADDAVHQRNASRDSLLLTAMLRTPGMEPVQVRVRNLSPGGLMAEFAQPVSEGAPIDIDVRGIGWIRGRVAWTAEGRIGVAFDTEINPLHARKPVVATPPPPSKKKPLFP